MKATWMPAVTWGCRDVRKYIYLKVPNTKTDTNEDDAGVLDDEGG